MDENLTNYLLYAGIITYLAFMCWGAWAFLMGSGNVINIHFFQKKIEKTIKNGNPPWEDIQHIQSEGSITSEQCLSVLNKMKSNYIIEGIKTDKRTLIESYISSLQKENPFEGLPDKLKTHLITLQEQTTGQSSFNFLVNEIRAIISSNKSDYKLLKWCTVGGFIMGFISFFFAIYQVYN